MVRKSKDAHDGTGGHYYDESLSSAPKDAPEEEKSFGAMGNRYGRDFDRQNYGVQQENRPYGRKNAHSDDAEEKSGLPRK